MIKSSKKIDFDANQFAHSQVEQIRSFIKQQHEEDKERKEKEKPPSLLGTGANRLLGKVQSSKVLLPTSTLKSKKSNLACTRIADKRVSLVVDVPLHSKRVTISQDEQDKKLFNSISHLTQPNKEKQHEFKQKVKMNLKEFKNPVAFVQRQVGHGRQNNVNIPTEESTEFR